MSKTKGQFPECEDYDSYPRDIAAQLQQSFHAVLSASQALLKSLYFQTFPDGFQVFPEGFREGFHLTFRRARQTIRNKRYPDENCQV
jgi:hypothetical protein